MVKFLINKSNLIFTGVIFSFLAGYILFSSLSTSLDFGMDKITQKQTLIHQDYEQILSDLTQLQNKDSLMLRSVDLGLTAITLADGYIDLRPVALNEASVIAKKQ